MHWKLTRLTRISVVLLCLILLTELAISTSGRANKLQEVNDASTYNARGLESFKSGKFEDAVKFYKQAIKLKQDYAEAHYNLGDAYFQLKQYKQAIEAYKQALRYQSNLPAAYNNMGTAYYKLGEHQKAIEAYKEAIRLDPKSGPTYYNLAATYSERGDKKAALDQYNILKTLNPEMARKLYLLLYQPMAEVFDAVSGIRLNVVVTDSQDSLVSDLNQDDFQVFEDSVPQSITSFSKEQYPLVYGLTVDTSGSMRIALPEAIDLAKAIIKNNQSDDETLLIRFISSDKIETVREFTSDKTELNGGLDDLYVEDGQSAIVDAVYLSAQRVAQYKPADTPYLHRAVVLITDGDERVSYYNIKDLVNFLRQIDVQVFAICLNKGSAKSSELNKNLVKGSVGLLTTLTNETGGKAFFPKSVSELGSVVKELSALTHTQYLIGYKPTKAGEPATYHRLNVNIVDKAGQAKLNAVARTGYTVPEAKPLP